MSDMRNVSPNETSKPVAAPQPKRRLRIDKLEERIAPKRGGKGTNNCSANSSATIATDVTCGSIGY